MNSTPIEVCGILKDYTSQYLEILNVIDLKNLELKINATDNNCEIIQIKDSCITNCSEWPFYLNWIEIGNGQIQVDKILYTDSSEDLSSRMDTFSLKTITAHIIMPEVHDMIVPRSSAVIRHGCPRSHHTLETLLGLASSETVRHAVNDQFVKMINAERSLDQDGK